MNEINDESFEETTRECKYNNHNKQNIDNVDIIEHNNPIDQFSWIQNKLQVT
jgi:hypothetical protein